MCIYIYIYIDERKRPNQPKGLSLRPDARLYAARASRTSPYRAKGATEKGGDHRMYNNIYQPLNKDIDTPCIDIYQLQIYIYI